MAEIGDEDQVGWDEACRREAAIRDLLVRYPKRLRISMVEAVAQELGVSRATLYRLIARYRQIRTVEGLRGPGSGRSAGTRVLNSDVETLIREILETEYLKPTRPTIPARTGANRRCLSHQGLAGADMADRQSASAAHRPAGPGSA